MSDPFAAAPGGVGTLPSAPGAMYDSATRRPPFWEELVAAWRYRPLVAQLVDRDVKVRYKRSALGVAWTMLNPLMMMIVLTIVFSHLFRFDVSNYPVYMLSATVLWNFFAQSTTAAMNQLMMGGPLLSRIYVPRTLFGIAAVGTGLVNLMLSLLPLASIMLLTGAPLQPALIWLVPAVLLTAMFALGLGLLLSALAVFFPDVVEMYQIALTAWYFLTPIIYPASILPESYQVWLYLNPTYYLIELFRTPIYTGAAPAPDVLLKAAAIAGGMLIVGWIVFTERAEEIAYRL